MLTAFLESRRCSESRAAPGQRLAQRRRTPDPAVPQTSCSAPAALSGPSSAAQGFPPTLHGCRPLRGKAGVLSTPAVDWGTYSAAWATPGPGPEAKGGLESGTEVRSLRAIQACRGRPGLQYSTAPAMQAPTCQVRRKDLSAEVATWQGSIPAHAEGWEASTSAHRGFSWCRLQNKTYLKRPRNYHAGLRRQRTPPPGRVSPRLRAYCTRATQMVSPCPTPQLD